MIFFKNQNLMLIQNQQTSIKVYGEPLYYFKEAMFHQSYKQLLFFIHCGFPCFHETVCDHFLKSKLCLQNFYKKWIIYSLKQYFH